MNIKTCYLYLTDKLNKLSTNFSQNLPYHTAIRAINEAQYYWYDERLKIEERDKTVQRELQFLIDKVTGPIVDFPDYVEIDLPTNYYHPSMLEVSVRIDQCKFKINANLVENANLNELTYNEVTKPDYDWEQTLYTIRNNKVVIYKDTRPDYAITDIVFFFYRKLRLVDYASSHKNEDGILSQDIDLEFTETNAYEILDIAAKILAGNINDQGRFQYNDRLTQEYK